MSFFVKTQIVPGKVGGGLQLSDSATSNRISVEGIDLCDLDGPWTISFWINSARDDGALFSQGGGELGTFEAELSDNNLDLCLLTKRQRSVFSCKKKTPLGEWQHIAVTCDGSGDREGVSIFVDGKEEEIYRAASNNRAHRAADSPEPRFEFGSTYNPRFGYTAAATIDEVRCYNLQLTPYDIDKIVHYQAR